MRTFRSNAYLSTIFFLTIPGFLWLV